ncbi:beta-lactamase family protein [Nocardioides sp. Y6]|uniref:Beta-lactamase family protein n=1 Tax=Nocardioides malaquae TaxID=2773426 RepID=A0ABR9RVX7_9ACTN|nr:serine hydrolase domain-containing protein [Nocardioides malaquae]MBE7325681.1 beta-lactamase family protein [Nocardioides malaquae]
MTATVPSTSASSSAVNDVAAAGASNATVESGRKARRTLVKEARAAESHCVAVVRNGKTVVKRDLARDVSTSAGWSITKSVTALLVGIAQDRGMLRLNHRVSRYVPAWRGTPSRNVRIHHLLDNTSGRQWSEKLDYERMAGKAPNKTRFAIRLKQQHRPGKVWVYNNSAIQVLEQVLERATGQPVAAFAQRTLLGPLGMRRTSIQADGAGNPMLFGGITTTCTDLLRLGAMLVDRGRFEGRRIVSRAYWKRATQRPSQRLNTGYGLLFWINETGPLLGSLPGEEGEGPLVPGAGRDAFWAIGLFSQHLFVSPSKKVVAVRLGLAPPSGTWSLQRFAELALAARR